MMIKADSHIADAPPEWRSQFREQLNYIDGHMFNWINSVEKGMIQASKDYHKNPVSIFNFFDNPSSYGVSYDDLPIDTFPYDFELLEDWSHVDGNDKFWEDELYNSVIIPLDDLVFDDMQKIVYAPLDWIVSESENGSYAGDSRDSTYTFVNTMRKYTEHVRSGLIAIRKALVEYQTELINALNNQQSATMSTAMRMQTPLGIASSIASVAERAADEISKSTAIQSGEIIKKYTSLMKSAVNRVKEQEALSSCEGEISAQFADVNEIANRGLNEGLRSWGEKAQRQKDAQLAFLKIAKRWKQITEQLKNVKGMKKFVQSGVPSYRFYPGQEVYVTTKNRMGTVVGVGKKNGTGSSQYTVRFANGKTGDFGIRELQREKPVKKK